MRKHLLTAFLAAMDGLVAILFGLEAFAAATAVLGLACAYAYRVEIRSACMKVLGQSRPLADEQTLDPNPGRGDAADAFAQNPGHAAAAAELISRAPDFDKAAAIFLRYKYAPKSVGSSLPCDAIIVRLRAEGETQQTTKFLDGELSDLADSVRQFLPKDPHGVNDKHRFEWNVMCFEGMWKEPDKFPRKDKNDKGRSIGAVRCS